MGAPPKHEQISLRVQFFFERPKSVSKKVTHKLTRPDLDKLIRGIMDALTGVVFQDDAQVTTIEAGKVLGSPSRAEIAVLDEEAQKAAEKWRSAKASL